MSRRTFELPVELSCFVAICWEVRLHPLNMRVFARLAIGVTSISDSKTELPNFPRLSVHFPKATAPARGWTQAAGSVAPTAQS